MAVVSKFNCEEGQTARRIVDIFQFSSDGLNINADESSAAPSNDYLHCRRNLEIDKTEAPIWMLTAGELGRSCCDPVRA